MVESDHDLRNSADFLVIDKIAKAIFRVSGIARIQTITGPTGKPIDHATIPFLFSMQGTNETLTRKYVQDKNRRHAGPGRPDAGGHRHDEKMSSLMTQMADATHAIALQENSSAGRGFLAGTAATYKDLRDGSPYDLLIAGIAAVTLIS